VSAPSLLSFLDSPIVVGDPDGRAAYVNPAFETRFSVSAESVTGQPLASLFEGGVREAILRAVAEVCTSGKSTRFRLRHTGIGYAGLASPIVAEDARVGFVILLFESATEDERIHALQRAIHDPLEEVRRSLEELLDHTASRNDESGLALAETGAKALGRLRELNEEIGALIGGRAPVPLPPNCFDPARAIRDAAGRLSGAFARAGVGLEVRAPAQLPVALGEAGRLGAALTALLRHRLDACAAAGGSVAIEARSVERAGASSVVIAVIDSAGPSGAMPDPTEPAPDSVRRLVHELGGELRTTSDPIAGRTTDIRLRAPKH